jgi:hypothetical protein
MQTDQGPAGPTAGDPPPPLLPPAILEVFLKSGDGKFQLAIAPQREKIVVSISDGFGIAIQALTPREAKLIAARMRDMAVYLDGGAS